MSRTEELKNILEESARFYSEVRTIVLGVSTEARTGKLNKEELCDIGFLCREIISQFEEIRKDIGAVKVLVDRIFCIKVMQETLTNPMKSDTIQGDEASGTPHYKKSVTLPKKDTEEYSEMLKYFGVSIEGIEMGVVKISWKQVCDHVTELAELGKPMPKFLPKIHDDYTVIHRRKR